MTTARDIITLALFDAGVSGVGQTPDAEDINGALRRLNMMLRQWEQRRWLVFHETTHSLAMTGALSYTIGPAGQINVTRPRQIKSAFARQTIIGGNSVDYPLGLIQAREEYNLITLKNLASFPMYLFYDVANPLGVLYPWPLPSNQYTLYVTVVSQLQTFANLTDTVTLPDEYEEPIFYNLVVRLRAAYQRPADPVATALAKAGMNTIRNINAQIPDMTMPNDLLRPGLYNIYSDTTY